MQEVNFRQAEKVLSKAQELLNSIRDARFSWPNRETFATDLETAATSLSEMRVELSKLVNRLSEHGDVAHGQGQNSDVIDGINKAYSLLSHLHDDVRAIERAETTGRAAFERATTHLQQIAGHYRTTRDRLRAMAKGTEVRP